MGWAFFSSGARPAYLENTIRSLALPAGEHLQVRYEADIVAAAFRDLEPSALRGKRGYFVYLDNADKERAPAYVPVREVQICRVERRGSSYVISLSMERYLDHMDKDLGAQLAGLAEDAFPHWKNGDREGCWVARLKCNLPEEVHTKHEYADGAHLLAFESTVNRLLGRSDFSKDVSRRMFINILDILDEAENSVLRPAVHSVIAGNRYRLLVYHFGRDDLGAWKPYFLTVTSRNSDVMLRSENSMRLDSPYDEKQILFEVQRQAEDQTIGIDLRLTHESADGDHITTAHLELAGRARHFERWIRIAIMAVALTASQSVVLFSSDKLNGGTFIAVLIGGVVTAVAALFNFKKAP